jgi:hypothetical protein
MLSNLHKISFLLFLLLRVEQLLGNNNCNKDFDFLSGVATRESGQPNQASNKQAHVVALIIVTR